MSAEIWRLPARDVAALVASRKVSAREVTAATLARLEAVNPAINAVVVVCRPEEALAQADAVDRALAGRQSLAPSVAYRQR